MSLSAREQQALDSIEHRLADSDPRLASLLATFSRLTSGEALPVREKIQAGWQQATRLRGGRRSRCGGGRRRAFWRRRPLGQQLACLLLWLVVSIALIVFALVAGHKGARDVCPDWASACAVRSPASAVRSPASA
ncbi:MAG: DUF3040 domain-containing protein, partial [Streptosporangiaceae bacterium]